MKKAFLILAFAVGLGVVVVAGCRNPAGCPGCSNQGYVPQSYAPANNGPSYNQSYDEAPGSGSGTRRTPMFQGSGSR